MRPSGSKGLFLLFLLLFIAFVSCKCFLTESKESNVRGRESNVRDQESNIRDRESNFGLTLNGRNAINGTIVVESVHKILDKNMVLMHKILDLKHVKNC